MCAVIKRGILGGFSNKIGNIVGTSWKGVAIMKSLPLSVANPRTAAQVAQRTEFAAASKFGSNLLATVIKPLWDRFTQQESGFNAFVRTNLPALEGGVIVDSQAFKISVGKMAAVSPSSSSFNDAGNSVTISWPTALPDAFASATDRAYVVVTGPEPESARGYSSVAARSAGTVTVTYDANQGIQGLVAYLAFARTDGTVVSNTGQIDL